jgi:hypothetical protein
MASSRPRDRCRRSWYGSPSVDFELLDRFKRRSQDIWPVRRHDAPFSTQADPDIADRGHPLAGGIRSQTCSSRILQGWYSDASVRLVGVRADEDDVRLSEDIGLVVANVCRKFGPYLGLLSERA